MALAEVSVVDSQITVEVGGTALLAPLVAAAAASVATAEGFSDDAAASAAASAASAALLPRVVAASYGVVRGSEAAIWDLSHWREILFQDSACTTPVTADGDLVGGVKDVLGDTNWDLIQADNSKRPTFEIKDGIPQIVCANGKGLYSRGNHTLTFPALVLAGLAFTDATQNGYCGFVKNTGDALYITTGTFSNAAAYDGRGGTYATTALHTAPLGTPNAIHIAASGSVLDVRQGRMVPATGGSADSDIASAYDDSDSVATMTFGVNCGAQSGGIGVPNASDSCVWFGGCVLMGGDYDRYALADYFEAQMRPEIRSTDSVYLYDGDSTGDGALTSTGTFDGEVFETWIDEVDTADNPTDTIYRCNFNSGGQRHTGFKLIQEGSSGVRRFHVNNSIAGSEPSYSLAAREALMFPDWLDHIDVRITHHGHNFTDVGDSRGLFIESENRYRITWPTAAPIIIKQHAALSNNSISVPNAAIDAVDTLYGDIHIIDIYSHWQTAGKPAGWYADGLHPTALGVSAGDRPPFDAGMAAFTAPAVVGPALLGYTDAPINTNGRLEWSGATLTGWTHVGSGSASRSTRRIDTAIDALDSLKLTQTSGQGITYRSQTGSAVAYRGQTLALLVRSYSEEAESSPGINAIRFSTDGTGAPTITNGHSRRAVGAWRDRIILLDVPADANTWEIRLYASNGAEDATCYYSQVSLVAGTIPKRLR